MGNIRKEHVIMKDKFGNEIDLQYCIDREIQSTWFKFDNQLTDWITELIDVESDGEDDICGYDKKLLQTIGLLTVGIVLYKHDGSVRPDLDKALMKSLALRIPYNHAKKAIDESRIKLAERIVNGSKGGRPSTHDDMQED